MDNGEGDVFDSAGMVNERRYIRRPSNLITIRGSIIVLPHFEIFKASVAKGTYYLDGISGHKSYIQGAYGLHIATFEAKHIRTML